MSSVKFVIFLFLRCRIDQLHQDGGPGQGESAGSRLLPASAGSSNVDVCVPADGAPPAGGGHPAAGRGWLHAAAPCRGGGQQGDPQVPH